MDLAALRWSRTSSRFFASSRSLASLGLLRGLIASPTASHTSVARDTASTNWTAASSQNHSGDVTVSARVLFSSHSSMRAPSEITAQMADAAVPSPGQIPPELLPATNVLIHTVDPMMPYPTTMPRIGPSSQIRFSSLKMRSLDSPAMPPTPSGQAALSGGLGTVTEDQRAACSSRTDPRQAPPRQSPLLLALSGAR